ncbi:unnamed protein product [Cochlearia groenlandica]
MDSPKQYISMIFMIMTILINTNSSHQVLNDSSSPTKSSVPNDPSSTTKSSVSNGRVTVEIINALGAGVTLPYHCKSKDDDFGARSLPPGGSWSFSFRRQFFGRSLFFCSFELRRGRFWFDIYKDHRDNLLETWCKKCVWKIQETRPCRFNDVTKDFDLCYPWNNKTFC